MSKRSFLSLLMLLAFVATLVMPVVALAQAPELNQDSLTLPKDDLSRRTFIDPLFGPISGAETESPLTAVVAVFNTAALLVAGILIAYTIIAGTMSTAHDGEMLGKKWSSMWVPIRTAIGVGAIMPVVKGGWCVAQVIVIWLAMQGAAIANMTWREFIGDGQSLLAGATYIAPNNLTHMRRAYKEMLVASVCVASHREERNGTATQTVADYVLPEYKIYPMNNERVSLSRKVQGQDGTVKSVGFQYGFDGDRNNCGEVMIQSNTADNPKGTETELDDELLDMDVIAKSVATARDKAFASAQTELYKTAEKIIAGTATAEDIQADIDKQLVEYTKQTGQAAKAAWKEAMNAKFVDAMKADGWATAGAFYMTLSKAQDAITREIAVVPVTASSGRQSGVNAVWNEMMGEAHSKTVQGHMTTAEQLLAEAEIQSGGLAAIGQADDDVTSRLLNWFMNDDMFTFGDAEMRDVNQNPVMTAKGLGGKMVAWAAASVAAMAGGMAALGGVAGAVADSGIPIVSGIGGAVKGGLTAATPYLTGLFTGLITSITVPGLILATYLPMMPYIIWIGAMLGWGILLIEAVIAAPLWAVAHIAPDGDGVVGRGGQGYMLVLSLVLRPCLMVLGLVAALVLIKPIGALINSTYAAAFGLASGNGGFLFLLTAIAGCIIYCVLMVMMVQRVFSLIHVIPDRLLRWIGGGTGNEIGEHAQAAGEGLTKVVAGGAAMLGVGNAMQNAMAANRDKKKKQLDEDHHKHLMADEGARDAHDKFDEAGDKANLTNDQMDHWDAANQGEKSARANERAARSSAKVARSESAEAKNFIEGYEKASRAEKRGDTGAIERFMSKAEADAAAKEQAYTTAVNKQEEGLPLTAEDKAALKTNGPQPFEEKLIQAAQDRAQAKRHRDAAVQAKGIDVGVRDVKAAGADQPAAPKSGEGANRFGGDADAQPGDSIDATQHPFDPNNFNPADPKNIDPDAPSQGGLFDHPSDPRDNKPL